MPTPHKLTVCVLFYGDHTDLARRCLDSLVSADAPFQIRVFLNACSRATQDYVSEVRRRYPDLIPVLYSTEKNIYKYPAMRQMFHDLEYPLNTPYVAWFDDDSYLTVPPQHWAAAVGEAMQPNTMRGEIWFKRLAGSQADWIRDQSWFAGKPVAVGRVNFITGGYWVIDTDIIRRFGWPAADIRHNGGDVMLGALCYQQGIKLVHDNAGVLVNADRDGKPSKSPRRGFSEDPVGYNYHRRVAQQVPLQPPPVRREAFEPPRHVPPKRKPAASPFDLDI